MGISSRVTGVDIGHHSIKAVTLTKWRNTYSVVSCAELLVPDDIFADNHMLDYQKIVKKLKELKKGLPLFSRKVAIAIPDSTVITKELQLDSYQSPETALANLLCDQVPFLIDDLAFDYALLRNVGSSTELGPTYRVYAARHSLLEHRITVLRDSGINPFFISPHGQSLLAIWSQLQIATQRKNWLLVDIGVTQVTLCRGGEAPLCKVFDKASCVPNTVTDNWMMSLRQQLHLYQSLAAVEPVEGIWLSGGGALSLGVAQQLEQSLLLPCEGINLNLLLTGSTPKCSIPNAAFSSALGLAFNGLDWLEEQRVSSR